MANSGLLDPDRKLRDYTPEDWETFLRRPATRIKLENNSFSYEGLLIKLKRTYLAKDRDSMQPGIRAFVDRAVTYSTCPECEGTRLNAEARSVKVSGHTIAECSSMQLTSSP